MRKELGISKVINYYIKNIKLNIPVLKIGSCLSNILFQYGSN